jgi:hypothetical protein
VASDSTVSDHARNALAHAFTLILTVVAPVGGAMR